MDMEKEVKTEETAGPVVSRSFRLYLPQGRSVDITVEGSTPAGCCMAAMRRAAAQYPGWRSIEAIPCHDP
jgi:hypothetical protein